MLSQAEGKRAQAAGLEKQLFGFESTKDQVGAQQLKFEINRLTRESAGLQKQADTYYATAKAAHESIPGFHEAAIKAATRMSFDYTTTVTPPPDLVI